jgi:hypothetical protein
MVSDLVSAEGAAGSQKTSVILTTHSMDECEVSLWIEWFTFSVAAFSL